MRSGVTVVSVEGEDGVTPSRSESISDATPRLARTWLRWSLCVVPRARRLLDRMLAADVPVIAVVAPPGYGKSTLLAAWAERRGSRLAWVSCDQIDDDPASLWSAVAAALDPKQPPAGTRRSRPENGDQVVEHATKTPGVTDQHVAVVLDHLEALSSRESRRSVAAFAKVVPEGWTLALASREEVPLPAARMRVERRLLEIGTEDLALSSGQTAHLLAAVGVEVSDARAAELSWTHRGLAGCLYLAALAIRGGEITADHPFTGTDRLMGDYLRSEVLDPLPRSQRRFLVRTSILDRVSGPLADAVVGGDGATRMLERLQRRNLLVRPHDSEGEWFRYHRLLRQVLQAELRSESHDLVTALHERAAVWFEENGDLEAAIDHAYLGGDRERFGRLVLEAMQPVWASGQIDTVAQLDGAAGQPIARAAHAGDDRARRADLRPPRPAGRHRAMGRRRRVPAGNRHPARRQHRRGNAGLPAGEPVPQRPRDDARRTPPRRWRGSAPPAPIGRRWSTPRGCPTCSRATSTGPTRRSPMPTTWPRASRRRRVAALVLAEQFQIAVERDDWAAAESLIKRALEMVSRGPFDDYWTSALVFASAARAAAHRGDMREAREHAAACGTPAPAAHLCAARRLGPGAARAGSCLPGTGRPGRCPGRAGAGRAASCSSVPTSGTLAGGRPAAGRAGQPDHRRHTGRRVVVDRGRAPAGPPAAHPPDLSRDRGAALHLPPHRQDPGQLGLPQARRVVAQGGGRPDRRARPDLRQPGASPAAPAGGRRRAGRWPSR